MQLLLSSWQVIVWRKAQKISTASKNTDIAACKCYDFNFCNYPALKNVPVKECCFLLNEKLEKKFTFGINCHENQEKSTTKNARKQQAKHSASADYIIVL